MELIEGSETSANHKVLYIQPLKMELIEGSETSANHKVLYIQPLKMELIEGSETSANHNQTPGQYPKEYIEDSKHGESLKSSNKSIF